MTRKAFMYSTVAIIIVAIALSLASQRLQLEEAEQPLGLTPILSASQFLEQLDTDFARALHITGYRGLIGLEEHVSSTGDYLDDLDAAYEEMLLNGSLNGTGYDVMEDATLLMFAERMEEIAHQRGLEVSIDILSLEATQETPFEVSLSVELAVLAVADEHTSWNYTTVVRASFPIDDLKDPLHTVGTIGRVPVTVKRHNVTSPFITVTNDTTALLTILNESMYVPNEDAPSFLMRFVGNLSASPQGISSLVNTPDLDEQDLPVDGSSSIVDYVFFGAQDNGLRIVNTPLWVRIDAANLGAYDAEGKTT